MTAEAAFPAVPPVRRERCVGCGYDTGAPVFVRYVPGTSGPGVALYACPACALSLAPGPGPVLAEASHRP